MTVITAPDTGVLVSPRKRGRRRPSVLILLSMLIVVLVFDYTAGARRLHAAQPATQAKHLKNPS